MSQFGYTKIVRYGYAIWATAIPRLVDTAMQFELYGYTKIVRYGYAIGATAITRLVDTAMQLELRL